MNAVLKPVESTIPQDDIVETQRLLWNGRFKRERFIWGEDPSITAGKLLDRINRTTASIVEIGSAYGRDMAEICIAGHNVLGIDVSMEAHRLASENNNALKPYIRTQRATFFTGSFTEFPIGGGQFDGLTSHRTLHLLGNNGLVRAFARFAGRAVRPGGILALSARSEKDFDEAQMIRRPDGFIEYKPDVPNRHGQIISDWNKARLVSTFGNKFDIVECFEDQEVESVNNSEKNAKLIVMVAIRKPLELV